jgi:hypothetical protein
MMTNIQSKRKEKELILFNQKQGNTRKHSFKTIKLLNIPSIAFSVSVCRVIQAYSFEWRNQSLN